MTTDAAGQITHDGLNSYTWDDAGRLKTVSRNGQLLATYYYDHRHRRTRKVTASAAPQGSGIVIYHYNEQDRLIAETTDTGVPLRSYLWADANLIAQIEYKLYSGQYVISRELFFELDHLGTPRQARLPDGRVVWRWESDGYGTSPANEDPDGNGQPTTVNLRFPGQYYDEESGLHYNWHRYYVPRLGRYLSSDPIGLAGGVNTYTYVGGNPLSRIDPMGLADVYFNAATDTLTVVSAGGAEGSYVAHNNAASTSRGVWPEGQFPYERYNSHPTRSARSDTGTDFIGFTVPGREFVGVHAGRQGACDLANRCGAAHATLGCIRTTPEAMDAIRQLHFGGDPIRTLTVIRP